jgi:outer membrane protein OmpA-like peptidoglycan-associated protein
MREIGTPDVRLLFRVAYAPRRKTGAAPTASAPPAATPPPAAATITTPADRDHDGVADDADQCPDEPEGDKPDATRPGCPEKDRDGDGIIDSKDNCPETPAGAHPDSRRPGCPAPDSDLDNVFDDVDACPDKPGLPNADPAKNGCPLPDRDNDGIPDEMDACPDRPGVADPDARKNGCPRIQVSRGEMTVLQPVFFATNEDTILPQSFPLLQTIASSLLAQPQLKRVSIEGHADDRGGAKLNQELSERRAASVMRFLIQSGVAPERLESHGFGSARPVTPKRDEESRARNRRVEFRILVREPTP